MKLFNLFKKKHLEETRVDEEELKKIPKKRRKMALKLLEEYEKGVVIIPHRTINKKEPSQCLRGGI